MKDPNADEPSEGKPELAGASPAEVNSTEIDPSVPNDGSDAPTARGLPLPGWRTGKLGRTVSFATPILIGLVLFVAIRAGKREPEKRVAAEHGKQVRVIEVVESAVVPRAVGYGVAQAGREWQVVAQVSGQVVEMHPDLLVGKILMEGTQLLKIDPEGYKLATSQRRAGIEAIHAQIAQLKAQEASAEANLQIEKSSLALAEQDLQRTRALFSESVATERDVENAERAVLQQRAAIQRLENQIRELPTKRAALNAQARESRAGLETAALDLQRTELVAPFTVRVRELNIQPSDIVTAGQVLAVADGIEVAEVPAQLTIGAVQPLLPRDRATPKEPMTQESLGSAVEKLGIEATVRLESGDLHATWPGKLTRFGTLDATTRTMSVVVAVDKPFERVKPGDRPPLLTGMYVEVELRGKRREGCRAVPRAALREGGVIYSVDGESRLNVVDVEVELRQAAFVCVSKKLGVGTQVVLSDLAPAVKGMLVSPTLDKRATAELAAALEGEGRAR